MPQLAYINFDVQVDRISRSRYRAQVLESSSGQAEHEFRWPFTAVELENFYLHLGQSRQVLRNAHNRVEATVTRRTRDFGERLFTSMFGPGIYACYRSSLDNAREQGKGLRIRLRLEDELSALPWEFLYDPNVRTFLSRSIETSIVRYIELPYKEPVLSVKPPLNMLVMIANPLGNLDVEKEWQNLSQALEPLQTRGLMHVERLQGATFSRLQRRLRQGEIHIFHFIGHGDYSEGEQSGGLLFESESGQPVMLRGDQLGPVLRNHQALRLAVLNACEGARISPKDPFSGVAQGLVLMGLPAVIAMQFPVTDTSAILFATEFYGALSDGFPVDAALVEARTALAAQPDELGWGTPVYFTRAGDGCVFDIQGDLAARPASGYAPAQPGPAPAQPEQTPAQPGPTPPPATRPAAGKSGVSAPREPGPAILEAGRAAPDTEKPGQPAQPVNRPVQKKQTSTARAKPLKLRLGSVLGGGAVILMLLVSGLLVLNGILLNQANQRAAQTQAAAAAVAAIETATARPTSTLPPSATATARPEPSDTPRPSATFTHTPAPTHTAQPSGTATVTEKPTHTTTPAASATTTADPSIPPANPQTGTTWARPADGMQMIYIPAGEFQMGSANSDRASRGEEKPQHRVTLDAYWIDRTEVTNAMFRRFVAETGYKWRGAYSGADDYPVVNISRDDAVAYCKWTGGSLPTEAQWEKAARGTEGQVYPWGDSFDPARLNFCDKNCSFTWANKTADDGWAQTAPVGSFLSGASPYGVLDMAGNALEWVLDWYSESYYKSLPASNPAGPASGKYRVLRGGSWQDGASSVRAAGRIGYNPAGRDDTIGFRCVR